jgi:hypothetical protein
VDQEKGWIKNFGCRLFTVKGIGCRVDQEVEFSYRGYIIYTAPITHTIFLYTTIYINI